MAETERKAVLERVPISKLRANKANVRKDFGDLDAFAAEFDDNPVYPGEPWTPLIVYRDANVYRIADGERRYRAMKKAGKVSECNAYVFDTMEEAVAVLVMLDTNRKQLLSEGEYSAGLQTALILGVPEEKVDARAGRKVAAAVRRQITRQGGKASQMSIDQMLAADEFADDQEAYDAIVSSDEDDWDYVYRRRCNERDAKARREAAERAAAEAAEKHGLEVVDKPPKGALLERTLYGGAADEIAKRAAEWVADGCVLARPHETNWGGTTSWEVYAPKPEMSPEEQELTKARNKLRKAEQAARKRRLQWVAARLDSTGTSRLAATVKFVAEYLRDGRMYEVDEFCEKGGISTSFLCDADGRAVANEYVIAGNWRLVDSLTNSDVDAIGDGSAKAHSLISRAAGRHVELVAALRKDGYVPEADELTFLELCEKAAKGKED